MTMISTSVTSCRNLWPLMAFLYATFAETASALAKYQLRARARGRPHGNSYENYLFNITDEWPRVNDVFDNDDTAISSSNHNIYNHNNNMVWKDLGVEFWIFLAFILGGLVTTIVFQLVKVCCRKKANANANTSYITTSDSNLNSILAEAGLIPDDGGLGDTPDYNKINTADSLVGSDYPKNVVVMNFKMAHMHSNQSSFDDESISSRECFVHKSASSSGGAKGFTNPIVNHFKNGGNNV